MSSSRIEPSRTTIVVEQARTRQTEPPATPFRNVLATGVDVLMTGAEAATSVVGGPVLAAAVRDLKVESVNGIAGPQRAGAELATGTAGGAPLSPEMASVGALQRESQMFNLQLLALQEEIQQENRRFSTISNVIRARHDTAKAAISNIRS